MAVTIHTACNVAVNSMPTANVYTQTGHCSTRQNLILRPHLLAHQGYKSHMAQSLSPKNKNYEKRHHNNLLLTLWLAILQRQDNVRPPMVPMPRRRIEVRRTYQCPIWLSLYLPRTKTMKKNRTTVYCLRCGLRYFKFEQDNYWCKCPEPESCGWKGLTQVPDGSVLTTQEQKL